MPNNILQGINVNGTVYKYDYEALENTPDFLSMPNLDTYYYKPVLGICASTLDDSKYIGWVEPNDLVDAVLKRQTADTTNTTPPILVASTSSDNYSWKYVDTILEDMFKKVESESGIDGEDSIVVFANDKLSLVRAYQLKKYLNPDDSEQ